MGLGPDRSVEAVEATQAVDGGDGDAEAGGDGSGGSRAGSIEDAAAEVGGERSRHRPRTLASQSGCPMLYDGNKKVNGRKRHLVVEPIERAVTAASERDEWGLGRR